MANLWKLRILDTQETIPLYITQSFNSKSSNSLVVYESPGANGGVSLNLGRMNTEVILRGTLISSINLRNTPGATLSDAQDDLGTQAANIMDVKDRGVRVKLEAPISLNNTFIYYIKEFDPDYDQTSPTQLKFNLVLNEVRQDNSNEAKANLVGAQPTRDILTRQEARADAIIGSLLTLGQ